MRHTHLLLLPIIAGGIFGTAQACQPDNTNTTVSIKSNKIYCTESLDSSGCNAQRNVLKIDVSSSCRQAETVEITCMADYTLRTRKYPEGKELQLSSTESVALEEGHGDAKFYLTINSLTDPILNTDVVSLDCRVAGTEPAPVPLRSETPAVAPVEPMAPVAPMQPAEPVAAPASILPKPETREIIIQSAPAAAPKAAEVKSDKALDLEILKEQNRARELDIKALELKIKLKEMER